MRIFKTTAIFMTLAIFATFVHASTLGDDEVSIVEHLNRKGNIKVENPSTLNDRLNKSISENNDTIDAEPVNRIVSGYRVQVFSDNNSRRAKAEARSMAGNISEKFPQYRTYVIYNSPFWRLRVGDFETIEEANDAATEIKVAFPSYRKEVRVVRDRVNLKHN